MKPKLHKADSIFVRDYDHTEPKVPGKSRLKLRRGVVPTRYKGKL